MADAKIIALQFPFEFNGETVEQVVVPRRRISARTLIAIEEKTKEDGDGIRAAVAMVTLAAGVDEALALELDVVDLTAVAEAVNGFFSKTAGASTGAA